MPLDAKFKGTCSHCGASWKVGEKIFYSREPKATCSSEECFETQKSKNIPASTGSFNGRQSSYQKQTITTVCPDVEVPAPMTETMEKVIQGIAASHKAVKVLYPDLDENTHTFGQIRSKLVDQLFFAMNSKSI